MSIQTPIPKTMKSLGVTSFGSSSKLQLLELPTPEIKNEHDILIKVKAVALNTFDGVRVAGYTRVLETIKLPLTIAGDFSGVVHSVGGAVTAYAPGDRVFGLHFSAGASFLLFSPVPRPLGSPEPFIAKMPSRLSFEDAAALTVAAYTAISAILLAEKIIGGLRGKTVLVPGGLGGVGSAVLQVLKEWGVGRVITTVSTAKLGLVDGLIGEEKVDVVVDYCTEDVKKAIGKEKVDVMIDTLGVGFGYLSVMKKGGVIIGVVGKSGEGLKEEIPGAPWWLVLLINLVDRFFKWRAGRWGVVYEPAATKFTPDIEEKVALWVQQGKLRAIIGKTLEMGDLEGVKEAFSMIAKRKGGIGKYVIKID